MIPTLHEIEMADGARFSPFVWRVKYALAHKGIDFTTASGSFSGIPALTDGAHKTVPILQVGDTFTSDSLTIAKRLDLEFDGPKLFQSAADMSFATYLHHWIGRAVLGPILMMSVCDIHSNLLDCDKDYFRNSRERRFGKPLEQLCPDDDAMLKALKNSTSALAEPLKETAFLGGDVPTFADYILFGAFQFGRIITPKQTLPDISALKTWFERCLDLYDGLGHSQADHSNRFPS